MKSVHTLPSFNGLFCVHCAHSTFSTSVCVPSTACTHCTYTFHMHVVCVWGRKRVACVFTIVDTFTFVCLCKVLSVCKVYRS